MNLAAFLAALAVAMAGRAGAVSTLQLLHVDDSENAPRCLDGSPAGFYYKPGATNSFVLWFEGGGWCSSMFDCFARSQTRLGSSTSWAATASFEGILNENVTINPDFASWSTVYVKYCDGGSFAGHVAAGVPVPGNGSTLFFRGRDILNATLQFLIANTSLANADRLVVTGSSAGGLSTYLHVDTIAAALPRVAVVAVPDAGFFPIAPAMTGNYTFGATVQAWMLSAFNITTAQQVNAACFDATPAPMLWQCLSAAFLYRYIQSPVFIVNAAYDWAQLASWAALPLDCINAPGVAPAGNCTADEFAYFLGWPTQLLAQVNISAAAVPHAYPRPASRRGGVNAHAASLVPTAASALLPPTNGGFFAACVQHEQVYVDRRFAGDVVDGRLMRNAIADWVFVRNASDANHWRFDVPWPGNPTCQPPGP